jgi:hypothetical protein
MPAKHVELTKFQMPQELDVITGHLLTADVLAEEIQLVTNVLHAQLDKLLIQITRANALTKQHALNSKSDFQEIQEIVAVAKPATSQQRFQTILKPDASKDQRPTAIALKEDHLTDLLASHAHSDKSEMLEMPTKILALTQLHAMVNTKFKELSMPKTVVLVCLATGQFKCQMLLELNASTDHLLNALTALPDNQMTDTLVRNAQQDKLLTKTILKHATLHNVQVNTKSEVLLINSAVVLVSLATGQFKCQMLLELNASTDHLLHAQIAIRDNRMMDTHALTAQQAKL